MAEQVLLAVADPGFPRGRDTNSKGGCEKLLFSGFSLKPPWNQVVGGGGGVSLTPLDPSTVGYSKIYFILFFSISPGYNDSLVTFVEMHIR